MGLMKTQFRRGNFIESTHNMKNYIQPKMIMTLFIQDRQLRYFKASPLLHLKR